VGKKEDLIDSAQKALQKGQTDKAIKDYRAAVALEPSDIKVRQRLAELFVRSNRNDDARVELEAVGKHFNATGFYLKSIAVYKQIEKLFPDDIQITLNLASLNEKHGLLGNAMAEYKKAYDFYDRTGNKPEAIKVLESMQKADSQNVNIRLKLAEVFHQTGKKKESLEGFTSLAGLLVEKNDEMAFSRLVSRVTQLFPDQKDFAVKAIESQIQAGHVEQSVQLLQNILKDDPRNQKVWDLIIESYCSLELPNKLKAACNHYQKFFPDALLPKEHLIRCLMKEKNYDEAIGLLESAEQGFTSSGNAATVKELFLLLSELAPIDVRVLEGVVRCAKAAGDEKLAEEYSSKIKSLAAVGNDKTAGKAASVPVAEPEPEPEFIEEPAADIGLPFEMEFELEQTAIVPPEPKTAPKPAPKTVEKPVAVPEPEVDLSDMYEIEVDMEETPEPASQQTDSGNWFDTVSDIFDNIATASGGVRIKEEIGDSQAHYDLGLAFKEMGLYDEAINALRQAAEDPARKCECMILQGACLREKGDLLLAESVLRTLLEAPSLSLEDSCSIQYELALTLMSSGKGAEATKLFCDIDNKLPSFRDVKSRIKQSSSDDDFDFNEDDLLDFDLK
jgi:tetratricopeptide (TPR) repeat protein